MLLIRSFIHCVLLSGNMFSTVRGHVFEWTLLRDDEAIHQQLDPDSILTFVKFKESSYSSDPIISSLEDQVIQVSFITFVSPVVRDFTEMKY